MKQIRDPRALDHLLEQAVAAGVVPGIAALAATGENVLYEATAGVRDVRSGAPVTPDTVFAIASMTKAVTAAAVLQLTERGLLSLDQSVAEILPVFGELPVLAGFDDGPVLRPPARPATVRDLLANTAGLGYHNWNEKLSRYLALTGLPNIMAGTRRTFAAPLVADPGTEFTYGTGTDWAGLVVEDLAHIPLEAYFRRHITGPLGMRDTDVQLTAAQHARAAATHVRDRDGWTVQPDPPNDSSPEFYPGGHCLYSTPRDYLRFQRALLAGGALDGTRILAEPSVEAMMTSQVGDIELVRAPTVDPPLCADLDFPAGATWGLGLMVSAGENPGMRPTGSAGWSGVRNTQQWIDPANGIVVGLYAQTLPFREPTILELFEDFERHLYTELQPLAPAS